ncbi:hypothetical protein Tco_0365911 [Tanacetum coccineum]
MQESEPLKKIKKRVQVQMSIDEELAKKVFEEEQARFNVEQEARCKAEQEQERIDFGNSLEFAKQLDEKRLKVRETLCMYLKNQGGYKMSHFKGMSYEEIRPIFKSVWDKFPILCTLDSEKEEKGSKGKLKEANKSRVRYCRRNLLKDKKHYRSFRKSLEWGNHTKVYQVFEDMLKNFDKEDLDKLWSLVKERFNSPGLINDKEKELWIELKRISHLTTTLMTLMLCNKLRVDQYSEMADELLQKIFILANSTNWVSTARRKVSTASTELSTARED